MILEPMPCFGFWALHHNFVKGNHLEAVVGGASAALSLLLVCSSLRSMTLRFKMVLHLAF